MLTHVSYSERDIRRSAEMVAMLERCAARGIVEEQDVDAFKSAFAQLLTVSTYNQEVPSFVGDRIQASYLVHPQRLLSRSLSVGFFSTREPETL